MGLVAALPLLTRKVRPMSIELLGPPAAGKTTLAHALATELDRDGCSVQLIASCWPAETDRIQSRVAANAAAHGDHDRRQLDETVQRSCLAPRRLACHFTAHASPFHGCCSPSLCAHGSAVIIVLGEVFAAACGPPQHLVTMTGHERVATAMLAICVGSNFAAFIR